jgi:low affinity Fe/Cu permease
MEPMERSKAQVRISRILHLVGDVTSRSGVAALVALVVVTYTALLIGFGFPSSWEAGFSAVASGIALLMLFVIQHTQSRLQAVTQLKLDELIRSSPRADDLLVHLEVAADEELIAREEEQIAHHSSLREDSDAVDD